MGVEVVVLSFQLVVLVHFGLQLSLTVLQLQLQQLYALLKLLTAHPQLLLQLAHPR